MILEILLVFLAFAVAKHFWCNRRVYQLANKIPKSSFDNSPLTLLRNARADTDVIFNAVKDSFDVPGLTKTWLGPVLFVNIVNPEDVKLVMNSRECIDKPYFVKFFGLFKGSLFGDIEPWQTHRKVLNPYFSVQALRSLVPIFNRRVQVLMHELQKKEGKGTFNVFHSMTTLTIETILSVMNFDVDALNHEVHDKEDFIHHLEDYAGTVSIRVFKFWLHPKVLFKLSSTGKLQHKTRTFCKNFSSRIVRNTRLSANNNDDEKTESIVEALIDPKNGFTEAEILDEVTTLIMAAQDTSAIASSAALLLLAMHKEKQEKAFEELRRVIGSSKDSLYLDMEQLNELEYLEMVLNEAMRLLPVVPFVFRKNSSEITSTQGYIIPANTNLTIPIFNIHRSKENWGEDAEEFKPERFSKENFAKIHPYAFLPFAKGSRMCIGWRYAMFLMKIQLANILLNYEIDTRLRLDELVFKLKTTINVTQGYQIGIKRREA